MRPAGRRPAAAGVILTLVVNAWIVRRQVRNQRDHESDTLARALLAELRIYHQVFSEDVQIPTEHGPTESELLVPTAGGTPVFDANVARLGLLRGEQIGPVLEAYMCLWEFDRALVLFSKPHESERFRVVAPHDSTKISSFYEGIARKLEPAIAALDSPQR